MDPDSYHEAIDRTRSLRSAAHMNTQQQTCQSRQPLYINTKNLEVALLYSDNLCKDQHLGDELTKVIVDDTRNASKIRFSSAH